MAPLTVILCTTARISLARQEAPSGRQLRQISEDTRGRRRVHVLLSPGGTGAGKSGQECGGEACYVRSCPRTGSRVARSARAHTNISTDTNTQQMSRCARGMARKMSGRCRAFPKTTPTCGILVCLLYSVQVHGKHVSV